MLKRIHVSQLRLGMYVKEFCGSWMEHPFWRASFKLTDPADIERIRASSISELWIDVSKGMDADAPTAGAPAQATTPAEVEQGVEQTLLQVAQAPVVEHTSMQEEIARAGLICTKAKQAVVQMFADVRMGNAVRADDVVPMVQDIAESVARNQSALISLVRLKTEDDYTYLHSVAVCALMMSLGRQLGLPEDEVRDLGLAGLLHDLGKARIPDEILNKPGKLTDAEFAIIRSHPEQGYDLLQEAGNGHAVTLDVCLHHHEKVDGTGYPYGLDDRKISLHAKMGAVCDVYDAITSNRPYKAGWDPGESIRRMAEWSKGHFDDKVFQAFVRCVGIYPVGSLVRLESGRLGVVVEPGAKSLLTPRLKVFYSTRADAHIKPEVLDLARPGVQDRIVGTEDASKWHFKHLDALWKGN
ncbi:MAG: HD-GYP domain-containing protein [Rhodocyclaceae bacterium]